MLRRILTAAVLIPVVVALIWWGPPLAVAAAGTIVVLLAMHEFFSLGDRMGLRAYRRWTMLCTVGLFYAQWMAGLQNRASNPEVETVPHASAPFSSIEFVAIVFVLGAVVIGVVNRQAIADILPAMAMSAAGLVFVPFPFSYLIRV